MKNGIVVNSKKTTIVVDKETRRLAQVQMANIRLETQKNCTMADYIKMLVYRDAGL